MIGKICGFICVISFIFGICTGNAEQMGAAVVDGASSAVSLTVSLVGIMALWGGIMRVAAETGVVEKMAKVLSPLLRFLFPDAYRKHNGWGEIAASISANFFGIGNAGTPLAVKAMEKLQENNGKSAVASDDMVMFTVLGSASLSIFPTTLVALRQSAGSKAPFEVIVPIWICSFFTALIAVLLVKCSILFKRQKS
ncbi:MAG: spore maturation protein A [Clostridia bacterium]|nr:spore maturation protein A [Clostridia bacterium]